MYRIDLHTHSVASPDGGLRPDDYAAALEQGDLHVIAVTDHNRIDWAQRLQKKLGNRIIVGEEISCVEGEIIGLYLKELVKPGLTAVEAAKAVRRQGGLVYVPHPFETVRSGIDEATLKAIAPHVDIIETHNGRAVFQDRSRLARHYRVQFGWAGAASSDAHSRHGWGRTYSLVEELPTRQTLLDLLQAAQMTRRAPGVRGILAPKINRLRKKVQRA
jgi:predicted metal-dependent phosphoesterase TrpH